MPGYSFHVLAQQPLFTIGEYRCTRNDPGLSEVNVTNASIVNIPQHSVMMKHIGDDEIPMDVNHAIFFNRNEAYRVSHPCGCGDRGTSFWVHPDVLADMVADLDADLPDRPGCPFSYSHTTIDSGTYLRHRMILRAVRTKSFDPIWLEETVFDLVSRTIRQPYREALTNNERRERAQRRRESQRRADTKKAHAELVRHTQIELSQRFAESPSLADVARMVHSSPYHLARVFRRHTGWSIHEYMMRLRLREALRDLAGGEPCLTRLAHRLGFSSHSRFTEAFRKEFGMTPSAFRNGGM